MYVRLCVCVCVGERMCVCAIRVYGDRNVSVDRVAMMTHLHTYIHTYVTGG